MKHGLFLSVLTLMLVLAPGVFAQDVSQWHLPEGAIARLGKGRIRDIKYSPDGTRLAVASSVGIWLYDAETYQEVALLTQEPNADERVGFNSVAFSPDGETMASASESTIQLWDVATGTPLRIFTKHRIFDKHTNIVFSPDGETLASSREETIHLWDVATGENIRTLAGHTASVENIAFNHDGRLLASASEDKTIRFWNMTTGKNVKTLTGHTGVVTSLDFSPDGGILASGGEGNYRMPDRTVRLWDVATGKNIKIFTGYIGVNSVVFSPDAGSLAVGYHAGSVVLDIATGSRAQVFRGHTSTVFSVAFSPDGSTLASASYDGTVLLWKVIPIHEGPKARLGKGTIHDMQFSADNTRLAVASSVGIWLYDAETCQEVAMLTGYTSGVQNVVFSPDSSTLASASWDGTVRLWDVDTGSHIKTFDGIFGGTLGFDSSIAFSPDGGNLAIASHSGVRLWDVDTGENTLTLTTDGIRDVRCVVFNHKGSILASASASASHVIHVGGSRAKEANLNNFIHLWDVATGKHLKTLAHTGHTHDIHRVGFSPNGDTLASASSNEIHLWDVATGKKAKSFKRRKDSIRSIAFSSDGRTLTIAGADNNTIRLWDERTGKRAFWETIIGMWPKTLKGHRNSVNSIAFSSDGNTIASATSEEIRLWDAHTGKHTKTIEGHTSWVSSVAFNPNGGTIASAELSGTISLWETHTGKRAEVLNRHTAGVNQIVFSPDGGTLASASSDKTVQLWDASIRENSLWESFFGKRNKVLRGHTRAVTSVAFNPSGDMLASASWDSTIRLWNARNGKHIKTVRGHTFGVRSVAFSPDGRTLASGGDNNTVLLWDVLTGEHIKTLNGHTQSVRRIVFGPDGSTLASASGVDYTIRLWDTVSGATTKTLHTPEPRYIVFSPDGGTLASSSEHMIRLWDVATGTPLQLLTGHTNSISSLAFTPDGKTLASGGWDGTVLLWDVTPLPR